SAPRLAPSAGGGDRLGRGDIAWRHPRNLAERHARRGDEATKRLSVCRIVRLAGIAPVAQNCRPRPSKAILGDRTGEIRTMVSRRSLIIQLPASVLVGSYAVRAFAA